ncbi:MAG: hypothetical protein OXC41_00100 [Gammaproteobacteria bacterium]|nr:hypothetical protein [Gammaproteobacteria bacterium]
MGLPKRFPGENAEFCFLVEVCMTEGEYRVGIDFNPAGDKGCDANQ